MELLMDFNRLPHAAIELREGAITQINPAGRRLLPALTPGDPAPAGLEHPLKGDTDSGIFSCGGAEYWFSRTEQDGVTRVLFHPAPQTAVTTPQLDGFLRLLRQLQSDVLIEFSQFVQTLAVHPDEETVEKLSAFRRSFYQLFRAVNNLEFLRYADEERKAFRPVTMDLAGLCSELAMEAGGLLSNAGVVLDFRSDFPSLLIPGDPGLVRRMLLGLLSNGANNAADGRVSLRLTKRGERAVLLLSQSGALSDRQMNDLLSQPAPDQISLAGQGAGLGMSVIRQIVSFHGGALFVERQEDGLLAAISLPTGPLNARAKAATPSGPERSGGLPAMLVELADVLPAGLFERETLD